MVDTLELFGKSMSNVLFFTCDNCSVNKKTAVISNEEILNIVHELMKVSHINVEITNSQAGWQIAPFNFPQCLGI